MELTPLHERLLAVVGNRTYRGIAELTGQNAETVRRYLQGASPSAEFLAALCARLDLNANWLITGHGPMQRSEQRRHALREANASELMAAVANALEQLTGRVDRIETLVNTLEVRLNGRRSVALTESVNREPDPKPREATSYAPDPAATADVIRPRPRAVADALAERPSSAPH